ncbi:MAG: hypothetical protein LUE93_13880, partial [Bacteroides sp.]|nr:hypothetical protein [Bacteroides sp.]
CMITSRCDYFRVIILYILSVNPIKRQSYEIRCKKQKAEDIKNPALNNSFNSSYRKDESIGEINFISDNTKPEADFSISWSYVNDTHVEEEEVTVEKKYEFITEWSIPLDSDEDASLSRYSSDFIVDWR